MELQQFISGLGWFSGKITGGGVLKESLQIKGNLIVGLLEGAIEKAGVAFSMGRE